MREEYQDLVLQVNDLMELLDSMSLEVDDEDVNDAMCDTIQQLEELLRVLRQDC